MERVGQEWGVGSELEAEGHGLTVVLLNLLLGCKVKMVIGARDLYLGHATHGLYILKMADGSKCVPGLLSSQDAVSSLLISSDRPGDKSFCWRNSTQSWEALG